MIALYTSRIDITNMTRGQIRGAEHSLGKDLLQKVLIDFHQKSHPLPAVLPDENGKPCLSDGSLEFNITHSNGIVVVAVSDTPIGVDIEYLGRPVPELVARKIGMDPKKAEISDWTHFECYCKLKGTGIFAISYPPEEGSFQFKDYTDVEGFIVSVCSEQNCFPDSIQKVDL